MSATVAEVHSSELSNPDPDTIYVVFMDKEKSKKAVKINVDPIPEGEVILRVPKSTGCLVKLGGKPVWVDPCPR